uniref:Retinaldehyde binding protein-related n=2 Tax=Schistosoma mansoni TaxID=6183 RepID=A0A3Q0KLI0_SCHMA
MNKKNMSKTSSLRKSSKNELTSEQIMNLKTELYQLAKSNLTPLPNEPDFATCDDTITRFLVARNYVVEDAFKQLKTAVEWRREYQPLTIQCKWCHETPGFHSVRQVGFDREGRPLMYACFAQCQTLKNNPDDVVCHMVYLIEHARRSIQTSVNTLVFIIDCTGLTVACCNPKIGKKFVQTFADCYPETLYKFILINHSTFFHGIWKAIKVFIDPNTVKKVKLLRKEKITKIFNEMFTIDTVEWLLNEIKLNKKNITENQLKFWEPPKLNNKNQLHDPRGTNEYIHNYIEPLIQRQQQYTQQQQKLAQQQHHPQQQQQQQSNQKLFLLNYDNLGYKIHMPHTNILDYLNKTIKQIKIQSYYNNNNKCIKPNKDELQAYGVDPNDNLSEISGGSED